MVNVTIKMQESDRDKLANFCENVGMSISTLFNVFTKKIINDNEIPFTIDSEDLLYCESNLRFLKEGIKQLNAGKGAEHELIEN